MFQINNMTQMSCNFREQSKIVRTGGIPLWGEPNQTSPLTSPPTQASALAGLPRGESQNPRESLAKLRRQDQGGGRGDVRFDIT